EIRMTSYDKNLGPRVPARALALVLALGVSIPLTLASARADSGDESTEQRRPPPVYVPVPPPPPPYYRPYYRPVPRRVYVAPPYYPRPRREYEPVYNPIFHIGIGVNGTSVLDANGSEITSGLDNGAGFDLSFGWRIVPSFSLDFNWLMSFHDAGGAA